MALAIERKELDEFCPRLFRTLDELGLLPLQLWAKPNEFEKYPRLLFGSIQRYNDVEAGFREWQSRVLRDATYRKEEHYPELEELRQQMVSSAKLFTSKANVQHLRTSLYARVFDYVYPRRVLVNAYCAKHRGRKELAEKLDRLIGTRDAEARKTARASLEGLVRAELPSSVDEEVEKLNRVYVEGWETIVTDARTSFVANAAYYQKVVHGAEPVVPLEEAEPMAAGELAETEEVPL